LGIRGRTVFQGESLWRGGGFDAKARDAFAEWTGRAAGRPSMFSLRTADWTLVRVGDGPPRLFEAGDAAETRDVYENRRADGDRLNGQIDDWHAECGRFAATFRDGDKVELTPEARKQLEQMGYLK